jgi:hypothetical protein
MAVEVGMLVDISEPGILVVGEATLLHRWLVSVLITLES